MNNSGTRPTKLNTRYAFGKPETCEQIGEAPCLGLQIGVAQAAAFATSSEPADRLGPAATPATWRPTASCAM